MARPLEKLLLTLGGLRIAFGIVIMLTLSSQNITNAYIALSLIVAGQATDHLDGYIARKYSEPTPTGYLQDSIADKLFQFSILIAVTREYDLPLLVVWGVFCREVLILATRIAKKPSQESLKSLKAFSIAYALFLRGALVLLVSSPIISHHAAISLTVIRDIGIGMAMTSLFSATAGLGVSTKRIIS